MEPSNPPTENTLTKQLTGEWRAVSPDFVKEKRVGVIITYTCWALASGLGLGIPLWWWPGALVAFAWLVVGAIRFYQIKTYALSWCYQEREEDLLIAHGVLMKELVVVPYGRMQILKVESGSLQRRFGLAQLTLVTAAASSNSVIYGLPQAEADALRDRLAAKGESQSAGL
jgi:membrane protein YdbS with pleckstrin-like domain